MKKKSSLNNCNIVVDIAYRGREILSAYIILKIKSDFLAATLHVVTHETHISVVQH